MSDFRPRTIRLSKEQEQDLEMVASIDGVSASELIRDAITTQIEQRRADPEFQARLRERIAADQKLLDRFAEL